MLTIILIGTLILLFVIFFYRYCVKPHNYWKNLGILQGKSTWLFGENLKIILQQESFAECSKRIYNQFPKVRYFGSYQFNNPIFVVRDPELIKLITIKDFEHFVDHRTWVPETSDPIWNNTLFALTGEKWKEMRTFLSPAFTGKNMRTMFVLMQEAAENFVDHFKNKNEDLIELDLKDTFNRYTCDVIATTAFGIKVDSFKDKNNEFYEAAREAGNFTGIRSVLFFLSFVLPLHIIKLFDVKVFSKKISNFFSTLVEDNINFREKNNIIRPDMIHLMMEARKSVNKFNDIKEENVKTKIPKMELTNPNITAQALIFILGGFETLSVLMRFLSYELAINPEIQEKLRYEINQTLERSENGVTYEMIHNMKYMDMVVSECLRKWPNALILDRVCTKSYTIPPLHQGEKELTLEKGTFIWIPTMGLHHDPKYYPNPEKFNPERFSDENKNNLNQYVYLPFGQGPRNCLGNRFAILETKVIFFNILRFFEIVPVKKTNIPVKISKKSLNLDGVSFILGLKKLY